MVTITIPGSTPVEAPATHSPRVLRTPEMLTVTGTIPAELDGDLLRAVRHPGWTAEDGGPAPLLDGGITFSGGAARWYREPTPPCGRNPTWRAAGLRSAQHEHGPASVARPVTDPATGLCHTVVTYPGRARAEHLVFGPDGTRLHAEEFDLDDAPLVHAVSMAGRYLVVLDLPVVYQRAAALLGERSPYAWQDDRPARVGLLEPGSPAPCWFTVRPCFVFNTVNAYQDGDLIVIDVIRHERAFVGQRRPQCPPTLWRWTLDPRDGSVDERQLSDVPQELPEVDPLARGRRQRYVFGAGLAGAETRAGEPIERMTTSLLRHDLDTGETRTRELGPARHCEQPVFVRRPDAQHAAEGDGWLVAVVHDLARNRSEVLILDAEDLAGPPVATVYVPFRLPASPHTRWRSGN